MPTLLALLAMLVVVPQASAQSSAAPGADRFFRIEAEQRQTKRGPVISGYVYNSHAASADKVVLRIEGLDAGGQVVSTTTSYVMGGVPLFGRTYFEVRVPAGAASYPVVIFSFEFNDCGGQ
jgi:hypothetical protein